MEMNQNLETPSGSKKTNTSSPDDGIVIDGFDKPQFASGEIYSGPHPLSVSSSDDDNFITPIKGVEKVMPARPAKNPRSQIDGGRGVLQYNSPLRKRMNPGMCSTPILSSGQPLIGLVQKNLLSDFADCYMEDHQFLLSEDDTTHSLSFDDIGDRTSLLNRTVNMKEDEDEVTFGEKPQPQLGSTGVWSLTEQLRSLSKLSMFTPKSSPEQADPIPDVEVGRCETKVEKREVSCGDSGVFETSEQKNDDITEASLEQPL